MGQVITETRGDNYKQIGRQNTTKGLRGRTGQDGTGTRDTKKDKWNGARYDRWTKWD